ncbi:unnamed protein product [Polarella glacialis]|uniref:EF-hand domain-containing protein n=1 Tax=Polarella glacialis TaxID=89957 RepID=A0A813GZV9_POLGL|nr:unnamed protein product [Polarella glacialis]
MHSSEQPNGFHESTFLSCIRQLVAEHDRLRHEMAALHQELLEFQGTDEVGPQPHTSTRMDTSFKHEKAALHQKLLEFQVTEGVGQQPHASTRMVTSFNEAVAPKCSADQQQQQLSGQTLKLYPVLSEGTPNFSELLQSISYESSPQWLSHNNRASVEAALIGVRAISGAEQEERNGNNDGPSDHDTDNVHVSTGMSKFLHAKQRISIITSQRRQTRGQSIKLAVWNFLEQPDVSMVNQLFHSFYNLLIALSVLSPIIASTPISQGTKTNLRVADLLFTILFTLEILIKLACCPNKRVFMESMYTVIDFAVVIAGYIIVACYETKHISLQLVATQVPILRLLKITRHSTGWHLLVISMKNCIAPLLVPLYLLLLMVVFSGSLQYWIDANFGCVESECDEFERPAFHSIPHAMWFVIVTVSSVGYGDVVPHTDLGKVLASIQIVGGVCFMAFPLSIVGSSFTKVWDDRHRLIMRAKLTSRSNGMDMDEMKLMFHELDGDGSENITFEEFAPFVESLELGLSNRVIHDLFKAIDTDDSRSINFAEFADFLFPTESNTRIRVSKTKAIARKVVNRLSTGTMDLSRIMRPP